VLALLALHDRPLQRAFVAGTLWPDYPEHRSVANLRTALARLPLVAGRLVEVVGRQLRLASWVSVDIRETSALAHQIIDEDESVLLIKGLHQGLTRDLLPDWYEDWVLIERERIRQLRLHGLEVLSQRLVGLGRYTEAMEVSLAALRSEPLRESAHRAVISVHLAEGNSSEAIRQYRSYRDLLQSQLGLEPSDLMKRLVDLLDRPVTAA
jgi:DNA-binding SARP family transcriptional activator